MTDTNIMLVEAPEETKINPVQLVTVKAKVPLFRDGQPATGIEVILLEEFGYELVSQIGLYEVGDQAIYIMPDHSLSDIELFEGFIRPDGDPKKSRLGSNFRIRAIKFNRFYKEGKTEETIYSNGILLPYSEVLVYMINNGLQGDDYTTALGITKWEEPEPNSGGLNTGKSKRTFPAGVYKTDEENINNLWGHLEHKIGYPVQLVGSLKVDGSSITVMVQSGKIIICSRNQEKETYYDKVIGNRKKTFWEKLMFWKKPDLKIYQQVFNGDDDFVKHGYPIGELLLEKGFDNIVLRGELNGSNLKGSGNKNNPARKDRAHIKFFGVDSWNEEQNRYTKMPYLDFKSITGILGVETAPEIFNRKFSSKEELLDTCNTYFASNMVEGIVVRTLDSTFSSKIMNLEYDSKK